MQKQIPITGIPAYAEYNEHHKDSWHKGFIIRNQTTVRLRRHHLELLQGIAKQLPLYLPRKMDLNRWEFGHAGLFIRSLARIQLRNQLVECNAAPVTEFKVQEPCSSTHILSCMFQSACRCRVRLDLDRLRDTLLDVLVIPVSTALIADEEFCEDTQKTLEEWAIFPHQF